MLQSRTDWYEVGVRQVDGEDQAGGVLAGLGAPPAPPQTASDSYITVSFLPPQSGTGDAPYSLPGPGAPLASCPMEMS